MFGVFGDDADELIVITAADGAALLNGAEPCQPSALILGIGRAFDGAV
jgi:hypothetical protein